MGGPTGFGLYRWGGGNCIFLRKDLLRLLEDHRRDFNSKEGGTDPQHLAGIGMDEFESFRRAPVCGHGIAPEDLHRFFYPEVNIQSNNVTEEALATLPLVASAIEKHSKNAL